MTVDGGPLPAIGICVVDPGLGFDLSGDGRRDALAPKSGR